MSAARYFLIFSVLFLFHTEMSFGQKGTPNALINESSPYLLQHAYNPVNWFPWGDEALEKANKENKLLIISIGYSSCHWCHVMEEECFEDTSIARIMNEHFVAIKVDREERPDIDQLYVDAAVLMIGSAGWPLNVVALPDGRPFFAGTYFPAEAWKKLLSFIIETQTNTPDRLVSAAERTYEGMQQESIVPVQDVNGEYSRETIVRSYERLTPQLDLVFGGTLGAPKFPKPVIWEWLLELNNAGVTEGTIDPVEITLTHLAQGGIYDPLEGGFSRYSTDEAWQVPHFEKMLYDNAQLVSLYTHAWQQTKNPRYKEVVMQTLDFIDAKMRAKNGAFYSSIDADSEGEEGLFYGWTTAELKNLLGVDADWVLSYYHCTEAGNWERGLNVLNAPTHRKAFADGQGWTEEQLIAKLNSVNARLLNARNQREQPSIDTKAIASWNAMMCRAYVQTYRVFGEKEHLDIARKNIRFIEKELLRKDGSLARSFLKETADIDGFLDDYAFLIETYLELYQATFEESWLTKAQQLLTYVDSHFSDASSGLFFYTSDENPAFLVRDLPVQDGVIPSANAVMARNFVYMSHFFEDTMYMHRAKQMFAQVAEYVQTQPEYYAQWARVQNLLTVTPYEVAITGKHCLAHRHEMEQEFHPFVLYMGGKKKSSLSLLEGKFVRDDRIYVCRNRVCQLPVATSSEAQEQLKKNALFEQNQ